MAAVVLTLLGPRTNLDLDYFQKGRLAKPKLKVVDAVVFLFFYVSGQFFWS